MARRRRVRDYGAIILRHSWDMYKGHHYTVGNSGHPRITRRFEDREDAVRLLEDMGYVRTGYADSAKDEQIWELASSS